MKISAFSIPEISEQAIDAFLFSFPITSIAFNMAKIARNAECVVAEYFVDFFGRP